MKHLDNNELGDRLQLVMNFIFVYSNCIKNINFNQSIKTIFAE